MSQCGQGCGWNLVGSHGVFLDTWDELLSVGVQTAVYLEENRTMTSASQFTTEPSDFKHVQVTTNCDLTTSSKSASSWMSVSRTSRLIWSGSWAAVWAGRSLDGMNHSHCSSSSISSWIQRSMNSSSHSSSSTYTHTHTHTHRVHHGGGVSGSHDKRTCLCIFCSKRIKRSRPLFLFPHHQARLFCPAYLVFWVSITENWMFWLLKCWLDKLRLEDLKSLQTLKLGSVMLFRNTVCYTGWNGPAILRAVNTFCIQREERK